MSVKFTDDQLLEMFGPLMLDALEPLLLKEHEFWLKIDAGDLDYRRPMDDRDFRFAVVAYRQQVNNRIRGDMYSWVKTWFPRMCLTNFGPESHFAKKYGRDVNWVSKAMFIAMPQEYDWTDAVRTLGEFIGEPVFSVTRPFVEQKIYPRAKAEYERRFKDESEELERGEKETITAFIRRQKEHRQRIRQDPNWRLKRDVEGALEMVENRLFPKAKAEGEGSESESELTPAERLRRKIAELTQKLTQLRVEEKDFAARGDYENAKEKKQEADRIENTELANLRKETEELERAEKSRQMTLAAAAHEVVRPPAPGEAKPMIKIGEVVLQNGVFWLTADGQEACNVDELITAIQAALEVRIMVAPDDLKKAVDVTTTALRGQLNAVAAAEVLTRELAEQYSQVGGDPEKVDQAMEIGQKLRAAKSHKAAAAERAAKLVLELLELQPKVEAVSLPEPPKPAKPLAKTAAVANGSDPFAQDPVVQKLREELKAAIVSGDEASEAKTVRRLKALGVPVE